MNKTVNRKYRVLITRPREQNRQFAQSCQEAGFETNLMPCLQIEPIVVSASQWSRELAAVGAVLFTSANAVRNTHAQHALPWSDKRVYAIGAATARALGEHAQELALTPLAPYNSESFLQQAKSLPTDKLLIIKGLGGRTLIQTQLRAQDWLVNTLEVYRRKPAMIPAENIDSMFLHLPPDIVSVTSDEVLQSMWHLCKAHREALRATTLVVNSHRCRDLAIKLGFRKQILVASPAGDEGQLSAIIEWTQKEANSR